MEADLLITFALTSALLSFTPGPDNIFVLTQSALHGTKTGMLITLGLCTGLIVHTSFVALGVAALIMVSTLAFTVLKLAGAAYLLYLAVQAWRASATAPGSEKQSPLSARQFYLRGILMNVSNPKVAIFFLAFLPQFTRPEAGSIPTQLFVLGGIFIVVALLVFGLIAILAGRLSRWLRRSHRVQIVINRLAAAVFAGLAARLALGSR